jgi:altronate dehydratase small subunit
MTPVTDACLLLLNAADNCLISSRNLAQGDVLLVEGHPVTLPKNVPLGYKLARHALPTGHVVLRYGAAIGSTTQPVAVGEMLHTHNLQSDYLPTYTLADGKRFVAEATQ